MREDLFNGTQGRMKTKEQKICEVSKGDRFTQYQKLEKMRDGASARGVEEEDGINITQEGANLGKWKELLSHSHLKLQRKDA